MTTVADIAAALSEKTRPEQAAAWDPVGLQLGDPSDTVESIAVCHEVTEEVARRIEGMNVDLLITYHPLLFEPVNRLVAGRSPSARALRLLQARVNLLVAHTDFDAAPGGGADALATLLKLRNVQPFGASEEDGRPDIGRFGHFEGTLAVVDAIISDAMGSTGLRITGDRHTDIDWVAVVPGSGSDLIPDAAAIADVLVTGDVPHHRAVRAMDLGLAIVDPGHIATERPGVMALHRMVSDLSPVPVIDLTRIDPVTWT